MDPDTGCWRRWGWKYLEKVRMPQSEPQLFGDRAHKEHEFWFASQGTRKHDLNTAYGKAAYAGLKWLPLPGPYVLPESWMEFDFDGIKSIGKIDLHFTATPNLLQQIHFSERALVVPANARHLVITDYKFTSGLEWRKTGDRLLKDPQRVMYATWAVLKYQPDFITTRWLYHRRKKPFKAEPSDFTEHRDEVLQHYPFVHEQALRIKAAKRKHLLDLPQNTRACRAFNRDCDFLSRCFPNGAPVSQQLTSMFAQVDATIERAVAKERTMSDQVFSALGIQPPQGQPNGAPNGAPQGGWGPPQGQQQQQGQPQGGWGPPAQQQQQQPQTQMQQQPQGQPQGGWGPPAQGQQQQAPQGQPQGGWGPPAQQQQPQAQAPQGQPQGGWGPPAQGSPQAQAPQGQAPLQQTQQWAPPPQQQAEEPKSKKKSGDAISLRGLMYAIAFLKGSTSQEAEGWLAQVKAGDKG